MPHVARRMLKVGDGWLSPGQPYPDELVTPTLLSLGWVEAVHDVPVVPPVTVPEEDPVIDDADAGDEEKPSRRRTKRRSRA